MYLCFFSSCRLSGAFLHISHKWVQLSKKIVLIFLLLLLLLYDFNKDQSDLIMPFSLGTKALKVWSVGAMNEKRNGSTFYF